MKKNHLIFIKSYLALFEARIQNRVNKSKQAIIENYCQKECSKFFSCLNVFWQKSNAQLKKINIITNGNIYLALAAKKTLSSKDFTLVNSAFFTSFFSLQKS